MRVLSFPSAPSIASREGIAVSSAAAVTAPVLVHSSSRLSRYCTWRSSSSARTLKILRATGSLNFFAASE